MEDAAISGNTTIHARILVVDDDALMRRKLVLAAQALGHVAEAVETGERALERLGAGSIDLVLLDLVMPRVDGFDVLDRLADLPDRLRVPVIVVSSLEEPDAIARAITLGAADFLPKAFNATILRARIDACLAEAQRRARDLQALHDLGRLTAAAEALDSEERNPRELQIDDLAAREGELGMLARVLLNKSISVYNRRQVQRQQIRTLVGVLLLLLIGVSFGLKPALAALSLAGVGDPLSVGFLSVTITAAITLAYAGLTARGARWPTLGDAFPILFLALLAPVLPQLLLFFVAGTVDSVTLAILMSLEAVFVFAIASLLGTDRPSLLRLAGLGLGLSGVALIFVPSLSLGTNVGWLLLAACMPACFAVRTVLLGGGRARKIDAAPLAAWLYGGASLLLLAVLLATGRIESLPEVVLSAGIALPVFAVAEAVGAIALIELVRHSGAVFAGQKSFTTAIGGVGWSIVLFGSTIGPETAVSLLLLLIGLAFMSGPPRKAAHY